MYKAFSGILGHLGADSRATGNVLWTILLANSWLMAGMMLAMECLTKGGYVSVRPGEGDQTLIIAESDAGVLLRDNVEAALRQDIQTEDLDPRLVHPYAISVVAEHYGYNLRVKDKRDDRVIFALDCPSPQSA